MSRWVSRVGFTNLPSSEHQVTNPLLCTHARTHATQARLSDPSQFPPSSPSRKTPSTLHPYLTVSLTPHPQSGTTLTTYLRNRLLDKPRTPLVRLLQLLLNLAHIPRSTLIDNHLRDRLAADGFERREPGLGDRLDGYDVARVGVRGLGILVSLLPFWGKIGDGSGMGTHAGEGKDEVSIFGAGVFVAEIGRDGVVDEFVELGRRFARHFGQRSCCCWLLLLLLLLRSGEVSL